MNPPQNGASLEQISPQTGSLETNISGSVSDSAYPQTLQTPTSPCEQFLPSPKEFDLNFNYAAKIILDLQTNIVQQVIAIMTEVQEFIISVYNDFSTEIFDLHTEYNDLIYQTYNQLYLQLANTVATTSETINYYQNFYGPSTVSPPITVNVQPSPPTVIPPIVIPPEPPPEVNIDVNLPEPEPCPAESDLGILLSDCGDDLVKFVTNPSGYMEQVGPMLQDISQQLSQTFPLIYGRKPIG